MLFGIVSAPEVFQKRNQKLFGDIEGVEIHFDDIVAGCDEDSHDAIMSRVLERAEKLNIKFNPDKLQYRVSELIVKKNFSVCATITPSEVVYGVEKIKDDSPLLGVLFIVLSQNMVRRAGDSETLGHMKEVTYEIELKITYYATHHGIYRPEKSTTKLRVVFNCSSLTNNGISLNDIQYNGGVIQEDLYTQMLRFRTYTYAFTADIKMMYRTILINPKQRNLRRIVWCESEHESLKIYELSTVTYGTVSAPYLGQRTLTQLLMGEEANFPIAASVLRNNLYMDDVLCGTATLEEAILLRQQIKGILKSAGMELHKLCGNPEKLSSDPEQNYNFATLTETKTDVLSTIAKIFDPGGLMAPIPRRILVAFPEAIEIHGFADASERCYGAAVYCESKNLKTETLVRLITSKSRVAPIKGLTIPRLELCAGVLLAKLVKRVVAALQLETAEIYLWSDSMIVLAWLRKEPMALKTLVQNRVAKIQELYPNQLWRHVPSDQNPADLVSCGVDPDKLLQQKIMV
ncbi:uncharacterized protein TNCV_4238131 [Trichonephila clavipes]|nr:uncharacterized protein TNCV_4238131 [Trichonephila clavipes]